MLEVSALVLQLSAASVLWVPPGSFPAPPAPPPRVRPTISCTIINGDQLSGRVVFLRKTNVRIVHHTLGLVTMRVKDLEKCVSDDPATHRQLILLGLVTQPPLWEGEVVPAEIVQEPVQYVLAKPLPRDSMMIEPVVMPLAEALPTTVERVGWKRKLDANFAMSRGNASTSDLRFVGSAARRSTRSQIALTATRRVGRRNGSSSVDFFQTTLRYDRALGANDAKAAMRPSFFSETIYEQDPFAKLVRRVVENTGMSIPLSRDPANNLAVETGIGIVHENFVDRKNNTRMGALLRLAAKQNFGPARSDQQVATLPDFGGNSIRYRFNTNANVAAPLTKRMALRLGLVNRYDTKPQASVKKSDTTIQTGIGIEF